MAIKELGPKDWSNKKNDPNKMVFRIGTKISQTLTKVYDVSSLKLKKIFNTISIIKFDNKKSN